MHCDFYGNDLTSKLTKGQDCGSTCRITPGCTHFTWTNHDGGRCFMKQGTNSKDNAIVVFDAVCGIIDGADTGACKILMIFCFEHLNIFNRLKIFVWKIVIWIILSRLQTIRTK